MDIALPAFTQTHLEQIGVHGRIPAEHAGDIDLIGLERTKFARVEHEDRVLFARFGAIQTDESQPDDEAGIHFHLEIVTTEYFDGSEPDANTTWDDIRDAIDRFHGLPFESESFAGYELPVRQLPHGSVFTPLLRINVHTDVGGARLTQATFQLDMGNASSLKCWLIPGDEMEVGVIINGVGPDSVMPDLLTSAETELQPGFDAFILAKHRLRVGPPNEETARV